MKHPKNAVEELINNMTIRSYVLIGISFAATFSPGTAWADVNIAVANPSFEVLPPGGLPLTADYGSTYSEGAILGWTNSQSPGASGQFQPGIPGGIFNYIPNGLIVAYSNGGTISQTVGATVQAGAVYTLSVFIGTRLDCCQTGGASADLLVDSIAYPALGTVATLGNWTQWTGTYTGLATDAGDPITIQLNATGGQGDFDEVVLTETPVVAATPEPGYYFVLASGLGIVMLMARSRSAKKTNKPLLLDSSQLS
jgi:hypothetical protein